MWSNPQVYIHNPLEQLKNQVLKIKSYKPKAKDIESIIIMFEKYFNNVKCNNGGYEKVIEYFTEIFIGSLHLSPNDKIYECFKKMVYWLNEDRSKRSVYFLIKTVVEICEKDFTESRLNESKKEKNQGEEGKKQRQPSRQRQYSRDRYSKSTEKEVQVANIYNRQNLKTVLNLIRKSGEKHMFDAQIYPVFLQYYLQRINIQFQQYLKNGSINKNRTTMIDQKKENEGKRIQFGSHILSELSIILVNRNKSNNVVPTIQKYLNLATETNIYNHMAIYLLLEIKNTPSLLAQIQSNAKHYDSKIKFHNEIYKLAQNLLENANTDSDLSFNTQIDPLLSYLIEQLILALGHCLRNNAFNTIPYLYSLYPIQNGIQLINAQHLLDRLFIHEGLYENKIRNAWEKLKIEKENQWEKWFKQFVEQHQEYIETTRIEIDENKQSKFMDVRYVIKLYAIAVWILNPEMQQKKKQAELESILNVLKKQLPKKRNVMEIEGSEDQKFKQFKKLYENCQFMLMKINRKGNLSKDKYQNQDRNENNYQKLKQHMEKLNKWKQILIQLSQHFENNDEKSKILIETQKLLSSQQNGGSLLQQWRIAVQAMFDLIVSHKQHTNQMLNQEQYYGKVALYALEALSIKPRAIRSPQKVSSKLFELDPLDKSCVDVMEIIVNKVEREDIVDQIKKFMSQSFDRVFSDVIRDKIAKSLFLCRCLLMTNHIPKCRILFYELMRYYDMPPDQKIGNLRAFLQSLLVAVPNSILIQFCQFLANRDKMQLRLQLFEKQAQHLDYLSQVNLFHLTSKSYALQQKI